MGIFSRKNKEEKPLKTKSNFGTNLLNIFSRTTLDEQAWQEIEDTLIMADVGIKTTQEIVQELKNNPTLKGAHSAQEGKEVLRNQLIDFLATGDRSLNISASPSVLMMVGINGTGKTTTVGKLAHKLVKQGNKCVLGAADTFRAAASQQLQTWGERSSVPVVIGAENSEPSAVAFNAVQEGLAVGAKVVIIDTAGRLHTKAGLMDELGKVKRVIEKHATVTETLLVIDATTGQNGLIQARVFTEAVEVTGIILTKLDGSAKGGIVIAVQRELKVPVKFVGIGEGIEDLIEFNAEDFVDGLLS
ncbi:MAG: signal recognition particle-docking protein FtsY [Candidatus Nanopelagicales bacterium]|jgi:fused signal recognition particle receptor|nr:signal recognition particle-docking protein FtsY [Candidatus Nanopelagicales bacterium]MDP4986198.1 signal recognition particle-docking protein FtsY [Candidatus Nanopelagicales bacterium]